MCLRYTVKGSVQGVGFRWFVRRQAQALQLSGWVRNLDDGDVEVLASGSAAALKSLREQLERGPLGARVTSVHEMEAPEPGRSRGGAGGFEIIA